jgi:guanine deaminase
MIELWRSLASQWDGRVRAVVSVSGPQRCTDPFQQAAWDLAGAVDRPLLTHVLESRVQAMTGPFFYGCTLVEHMRDLGVLGRNSVLIHGVWMSDEDLDIVAESGAAVSHNPVSNLKLGSGIAPVIGMLNRGIPVGVGTDNHNANDGCSMFQAVKLTVMLQSVLTEDYRRWLDAPAGLRAGTERGARAMGLDDRLGRLEPGFQADFLVFDLSADAFLPLNDPVVHLACGDPTAALESAYVAGEPVLRDRQIVTVDEAALRQELSQRIAVIHKTVLDGVPSSRRLEPYLAAAYDKCLAHPLLHRHRGYFNCCGPG